MWISSSDSIREQREKEAKKGTPSIFLSGLDITAALLQSKITPTTVSLINSNLREKKGIERIKSEVEGGGKKEPPHQVGRKRRVVSQT